LASKLKTSRLILYGVILECLCKIRRTWAGLIPKSSQKRGEQRGGERERGGRERERGEGGREAQVLEISGKLKVKFFALQYSFFIILMNSLNNPFITYFFMHINHVNLIQRERIVSIIFYIALYEPSSRILAALCNATYKNI
jgi:hypothetical protein